MSLEQPLISIITPVLNGEKHLQQTLDSVKNQTYKNIEHIVIDGGSKDNSVNIIKKHCTPTFRWISEPDDGISDAFNKGIKMASGKIVGIINADDWYEPKALEIVVDNFNTSPEFDILYGKTKFITGQPVQPSPKFPLAHAKLFQYMSIRHPSVFVKKKIYDTMGLFDLDYKLAMDYEFLLRSLLGGAKFKFVDHHLANFRTTGISMQFFQKGLKECEEIRARLYRKFNVSYQ